MEIRTVNRLVVQILLHSSALWCPILWQRLNHPDIKPLFYVYSVNFLDATLRSITYRLILQINYRQYSARQAIRPYLYALLIVANNTLIIVSSNQLVTNLAIDNILSMNLAQINQSINLSPPAAITGSSLRAFSLTRVVVDVNQLVQEVLDGGHAAQDDGMERRHPLLFAVTQLEAKVPDTLQGLDSAKTPVNIQHTHILSDFSRPR